MPTFRLTPLLLPWLLLVCGAGTLPARALEDASVAVESNAPITQAHGRLVLVLPFNNHSTQPNLDWIGETFPEVLNKRLAAAGFLPISRVDRLYALDHLGLPLDFQPSHASTLRISQMLDADYVIVGSYEADGKQLKATARVLDVAALTLGAPIDEQGDLPRMLSVDNSLAWRVAKALDPSYAVAEQTFVAADSNLGIDAFENYIRGLVESSDEERIKHLKEAVRLNPDFPSAWYALGRTYFADQQYELAATALGHLPKDDPNALAADFYRGLAFFNSGNYLKAEDAFAFVTTRQPLPEVVNNQAVAASRRGKDATPLFEQAVAADPKDPDYHFNLAVSLRSRNDVARAIREIEQAIKLRSSDMEAREFDAALKAPPPKSNVPETKVAGSSTTTPGGSSSNSGASPNAGTATRPMTGPSATGPSATGPTATGPDMKGSIGSPGASTVAGTSTANVGANVGVVATAKTNVFTPGSGPGAPLERIKRTYNEASFRQAAFAVEQVQGMRLASLKPAERAARMNQDGVQFLDRGLMLEAERQFLSALQVDASSAEAHAGLAQVRERTGDPDAARGEATKSLSLRQNAVAHLVLARLDMQSNQLGIAAGEVRQALNLEPGNSAAKGLRLALEARGQQVP